MREQQQPYAKEVQPQPEPVVKAAAAMAAAAVLAAAALAARGGIGSMNARGALVCLPPPPRRKKDAVSLLQQTMALEEGITAHKAEVDIQQAVEDEEAIVHIARAGAQPGQAPATAEWPELPATC